MKGLLIKDYCLIKSNSRLYMILPLLAILLLITNENITFSCFFLTFCFSMMVLTTISYDEFDKSNAYLMTMPVTRKMYVLEKYCFGLLVSLAGWMMAVVFILIRKGLHISGNDMGICLMALYAVLFMLLVTLPVQLKFGGDNGKVVLVSVIVLLILAGMLITRIAVYLSVDFSDVTGFLQSLSPVVMAGAGILLHLALIAASWFSALHIMQKKEF